MLIVNFYSKKVDYGFSRVTKERSMPVRAGEHVPLMTGYVGEKLYVDLISMWETIRGNQYMLKAEDSFC